ncbi:hypothetical protein MHK_000216 [Candidatus Magnetomorum sp. HK-1]|nr:hypothetical protein MHK_000216 [Candidatus Magnetomorum sp. HK-1]
MEINEKKITSLVRSIVNPIMDKLSENLSEDLKKSSKEFDKRLAEVSKQIGGIGNNNGDYAEEFFLKSLEKTMQIGTMEFDSIDDHLSRYIKAKKIRGEYDIILTNTKHIVVVEVKYKLTKNYVNDFYNKKLKNFKDLFPIYKNYKIYGAVASFSDHDNARKLSREYGLFVLGRSGEKIDVINDNVREYEN